MCHYFRVSVYDVFLCVTDYFLVSFSIFLCVTDYFHVFVFDVFLCVTDYFLVSVSDVFLSVIISLSLSLMSFCVWLFPFLCL